MAATVKIEPYDDDPNGRDDDAVGITFQGKFYHWLTAELLDDYDWSPGSYNNGWKEHVSQLTWKK